MPTLRIDRITIDKEDVTDYQGHVTTKNVVLIDCWDFSGGGAGVAAYRFYIYGPTQVDRRSFLDGKVYENLGNSVDFSLKVNGGTVRGGQYLEVDHIDYVLVNTNVDSSPSGIVRSHDRDQDRDRGRAIIINNVIP